METVYKVYIGFLICALVALLLVITDTLFFDPIRADKAQQICINRGYDNYNYYHAIPLSYEVYGVTCNYVDYSRKSIDINSNSAQSLIIS